MDNRNSFAYHQSCIPDAESKRPDFYRELEKKFSEELSASPKAKAYFEKFNADSVASFINSYARQKMIVVQFADYYDREYRRAEESDYVFHERAERALMLIQQKKLFNLQLQWRAGQLKFTSHPEDLENIGLDIGRDFDYWSFKISSCPFIDPVTEQEKDIMKAYLQGEPADRHPSDVDGWYGQWQNYDFLTRKDEDGNLWDMPEWYEFYDLRTGTGILLLLPDVMTDKEDFYIKLSVDTVSRAPLPPPPPPPPADNRPYLPSYGEDIIKFAAMYETDKYFVKLLKGYEAECEKDSYEYLNPFELDYSIGVLKDADRPIYLPSHLPWERAVAYAAKKHKNIRTAEVLDIVYDEYLMRTELGVSINDGDYTERLNECKKASVRIKEMILKGRVKNGEPANFDY